MSETDAKRPKTSEEEVGEYEKLEQAVAFIQSKFPTKPVIGIICGSGLGGLADLVKEPTRLTYSEIPHFPTSTVAGHDGSLILGELGGAPVVVMKGRLHFYEGYSLRRIAHPIRTLCKLGIKALLVTNAAGGLNTEYKVGDLMLLKDHLNLPGFAGQNPLIGPHDERYGGRFVPMSKAYPKQLRDIATAAAEELGLGSVLRQGVYAMVAGPTYETPAEACLIARNGADAVGMSTVPEVIVAVQAGVKCMAMSLITNNVVLNVDEEGEANHAEVLAAANARQPDVQNLFINICTRIKAQVDTGKL
ncbi:inosine guanosine and xanthosine phosphorylase [Salpingoeca rosetta]|uniref:Purine nucleoside phosphorylase n=1 Tax=Salpingoeca rosetta (strain ATCC 50818 / BSB-021) TaxID=946362 RepID=F2UQ33_SALR5|nr:inosine guanosine and xanthosine phosphorylase [Salpingoeca rosetta]EGD79701.1 inosine guanosine and xanthosine phosphorylase [Salpingoeca rosetta]|eukprot:XP_004988651.1 inosine guanosine and xanthosine phosphorylase [Salpingoeca rosetta]